MLKSNEAFVQYLIEFHATRDFFECHEIMEEYWKSQVKDEFSQLWVAFIQVAVAQYHDRRKNKKGAYKMYTATLHKFNLYRDKVKEIDLYELCEEIEKRLNHLDDVFVDINMVIKDETLKKLTYQLAEEKTLQWGISSQYVSDEIKERHKLRDRSDVIEARQQALELKKEK